MDSHHHDRHGLTGCRQRRGGALSPAAIRGRTRDSGRADADASSEPGARRPPCAGPAARLNHAGTGEGRKTTDPPQASRHGNRSTLREDSPSSNTAAPGRSTSACKPPITHEAPEPPAFSGPHALWHDPFHTTNHTTKWHKNSASQRPQRFSRSCFDERANVAELAGVEAEHVIVALEVDPEFGCGTERLG